MSDAGPPGPEGAVAHALRRLAVYVRRNRAYYALCVLAILGYNVGFIAVPVLVGWVVAAAVEDLPRDIVAFRSACLLAAVLFASLLRYFSRTLVFNAAREIEYEIRNDLFAQLQRLPQSFYSRWRTGDLMSRCVNDLNSVRLLLGPGLLSVIQTPILFVGVIAVMFTMNAKLALLVLLPYPGFVLIARVFGGSLHARNLAVQTGLADLSSRVQEMVAGVAAVKAYAMEEVQAQRFAEDNETLYRRHLRLVRVMGIMPAVTGMLPALAMFMVLLVGGREISAGRMQIDTFFTFAMFIYQLTFPTFIMGWVVALVQRGAAAMQRIDEILSARPSIADPPDAVQDLEIRGEIEFRGLNVAYPASGDEPALRDIRLRIPAGSSLGVVGPVGSGKTTLASAIPHLCEVADGELFLDGVDVNRIPLATLRSAIAMVPQDSFLFSTSLADNIAFGLPETDLERVMAASLRAQLHKDIAELPEGYATGVGERGVMLSGGQRQRAALARALILERRILILDDTFSSVDAETEVAIQSGLADFFEGRTVVLVASRVSSVQRCDRIAVLDRGRIVELGSDAELRAAEGLYARLVQREEQEREREAQLASIGEVA